VDGEIGEFCIFARQRRGGEDWYIGGVNNNQPREVTIPMSMLDSDKTYLATLYRDGEQADWNTNPYNYKIEEIELTCADTLHLKMASGGGFALSVLPK
jgi:alpha-glucosidase